MQHRRTQEERSAATVAKLLDATIDSLMEVGYEHTTSRSVAERAGVSRGAQSHHFPRRVDLIVSAVERMGELLQARAIEELDAVPLGRGHLRAMIDTLWSHYTSPVFPQVAKLRIQFQDYGQLIQHQFPGYLGMLAGAHELHVSAPKKPDQFQRFTGVR